MAKRRFIQMREPPYDLVEVSLDYMNEPPRADGLLYGDRSYDGMQSTDGADISSRTKHREYMKQRGLTTADDFKETWKEARKQRDQYFTEGPRQEVRQDLLRTISALENKK